MHVSVLCLPKPNKLTMHVDTLPEALQHPGANPGKSIVLSK